MSGHFVERRFELGDDAEIVLRIAPPVSDGANFRCDYEVIWPDRTDRSSGFGVDGVQALLNALHSTRHNLMASDDFASGRLTWCDERDLGLPQSRPWPARPDQSN